jgi:putative SOS response-associated peptidase YedK
MCGRFVSARKRLELLEEFGVARDRVADSADREPDPDYNVAPTKRVYAVMTRHEGDKGEKHGKDEKPDATKDDKARELRVVRWGLVPFWAKEASSGGRLINARSETVAVKPAFRRAFAKRRCILPADGYYEWQVVTEQGKQRKQPYFIHPKDGGGMAFAGLYELWRDQTVPEDHERAWLWTAAIITTKAADEVGQIHDRMPMVIAPEHWEDWLDPDLNDPSEFQAAMQPAMDGRLTSFAVSMAVNAVRNNGPELIEPLAGGEGSSGD